MKVMWCRKRLAARAAAHYDHRIDISSMLLQGARPIADREDVF
jgi:hypothetical protein